MGKVRVYSLAQELDIKSNVLLEWLHEMGHEINNHMSAIEDETADILRNKAKAMKQEGGGKEVKEVKPIPSVAASEQKKETKSVEVKKDAKPSETTKESKPAEVKKDLKPQEIKKDSKPHQPEGKHDAKTTQFAGKRDGKPQERREDKNTRPQNETRKDNRSNFVENKAENRNDNRKDNKKDNKPQQNDPRRDAKANDHRENRGNKDRHSNNDNRKEIRSEQNNKPQRPKSQVEPQIAHVEMAEEIAAVESKVNTPNTIEVQLPMNVKSLAEVLDVNPNLLIAKLIGLGVMATINQNLDPEAIELLAEDCGKHIVFKTQEEKVKEQQVVEDRPEDLQPRPPIVTIMGHVDHGKTSLLDVIRHTNVTASEAGGITQHIGAYQTTINGKKITFLDTPGHEAFTAMRARGAQLTDIAVLVVAADDGVMPQTVEAINHAKAAGISIIVAVNKVDKEEANPDRVLQELTEHGLIAEAWGGDTICVNVSALKKQNIDNLLEMILLVAEMGELKANPDRPADGIVIDAQLDKGRGPVATVLVKRGTLKIGDPIIAGSTFGRVRAMINDKGERVDKATPATPVVVLGLSDVPSAGDIFEAVDDDKTARNIAEERAQRKRLEEMQTKKAITLEDLFAHIKDGEVKELNLILKADVQGSVEAVRDSLLRLSNEEVRVMPIHTGVGAITETDVSLASASNAIIIGFNVRPDLNARKLAEAQKVEIRTYRIIYQAIEEVRAALEGLLDPDLKEVVTGRAVVRATFKVPKMGTIAGLYITDGKINRNSKVRLLRNGVVIHEGRISSLKRFQDDVREVAENYECGLGIENFNDIKEGDEIEVFIIEEIRRTLD